LTLMCTKPNFEGNGIDHYIVERSEDGHAFTSVGTVSNTAFVDINVLQNVTYFYRVRASDGVGNFGGSSAIISKAPLGRYIEAPKIVTTPTSKVSFNQAEINWVTSRESTSFVYFGSSPSTLDQSKGTLDLTANHSVLLTGLAPKTLYYFKVQSFDIERDYNLNTTYSGVYSFRTLESGNVSMVSVTDVTLNTAIINWQTSVPTKATIEYGTKASYGLLADETSGYGENHILRMTNLNSGTNYHFRVIPEAENGGKFYSDDYQFTTISHPTISNIRFQPILDATNTAVEVTWKTNVPTDSIISYRTEGVNQETAKSDLVSTHTARIENLASNAEYSFTIKGRDKYGNLATSEVQKWKSSLDTRPPKISDVSVDINTSGVGGDAKVQLVIFWKTDEPATSQVQYGSGSMGELTKKTELEMEYTTNHVAVISNLELSQVYRIKPLSRDMSGNESYGEERVVVTQDKDFSILEILVNLLKGIIGE